MGKVGGILGFRLGLPGSSTLSDQVFCSQFL